MTLYRGDGQAATRIAFANGERRRVEELRKNGAVRELRETTATGTLQRRFAADGTKLLELQWLKMPPRERSSAEARSRSVKVLEQEFHTSGKLVHETRWAPDDRAGAVLVSESHWYLNGQPKEHVQYAEADGQRTRRETSYYDSGRTSFEGTWVVGSPGARIVRSERPTGTHARYDEQGRLRSERIYDDRGRVTRERELDESGAVVRDDEVFEDGSRKSLSR